MKRKIFLLGVIFLGAASVLFNNDKKEEATPKTKKPEVKVEVPPMETAEATVEEEEIATPQQETNYDGWFESSSRKQKLEEYENDHYGDQNPNMGDNNVVGNTVTVEPYNSSSDKNEEEATKKEEEGWQRLDSSAPSEEQNNEKEE